jgi:hypothetical protein
MAWGVVAGEITHMTDIDIDACNDLGLTHGGSVSGGND